MAFEASASASYASTSQESVVAARELLFVLNTLNEKHLEKKRKMQHFQQHQQQHPDPRLKHKMPEVIETESQSTSQSHKPMELSQIELIYRAEGNANLVLALPQFKKVLRLPKIQQQQLEQGTQYQDTEYNQKHFKQQQLKEEQHMQQQQSEKQLLEPKQSLTSGQQQNKNGTISSMKITIKQHITSIHANTYTYTQNIFI